MKQIRLVGYELICGEKNWVAPRLLALFAYVLIIMLAIGDIFNAIHFSASHSFKWTYP